MLSDSPAVAGWLAVPGTRGSSKAATRAASRLARITRPAADVLTWANSAQRGAVRRAVTITGRALRLRRRVRHRGYEQYAENKHPNEYLPSSVSCSLALPVSQDREHIDRNHGRADVAVPPLPARAALRDREEPKLAGSSKCRHDTKRTADKRTKVYLAKQNDFTLCTCRGRRSTVPPLAPHPHLPPPGLPG